LRVAGMSAVGGWGVRQQGLDAVDAMLRRSVGDRHAASEPRFVPVASMEMSTVRHHAATSTADPRHPPCRTFTERFAGVRDPTFKRRYAKIIDLIVFKELVERFRLFSLAEQGDCKAVQTLKKCYGLMYWSENDGKNDRTLPI
jgi:hypothetical protein